MKYSNTPAQQDQRDNMRATLSNTFVPKDLREHAMRLCKTISDIERRTHAKAFVLFAGRSTEELERFIERMTPKTQAEGAAEA